MYRKEKKKTARQLQKELDHVVSNIKKEQRAYNDAVSVVMSDLVDRRVLAVMHEMALSNLLQQLFNKELTVNEVKLWYNKHWLPSTENNGTIAEVTERLGGSSDLKELFKSLAAEGNNEIIDTVSLVYQTNLKYHVSVDKLINTGEDDDDGKD